MSIRTIHYLDPVFAGAERLPPSKIAAKIKAGWVWRKLSPGFSATGGTASYMRALENPSTGEIAFVSDRSAGPDRDYLPEIITDYSMLRLNVPFSDKDGAKALGAIWVSWRKCWACAPANAEKFTKWIGSEKEIFNLIE